MIISNYQIVWMLELTLAFVDHILYKSDFVITCVNYVSIHFSCSIQMILSYSTYRKDTAHSVDINGKTDSGLRENIVILVITLCIHLYISGHSS